MKKKQLSNEQLALLLASVTCAVLAALCFAAVLWLSHLLDSQKEAKRWQGDSDMPFSQVTCFLPADQQIELRDVADFRTAAMKKLQDASQDVTGEQQLMLDAWSTAGKVVVSSLTGRGDAAVIAVGGNFFDFHPIRLLDGDYLHQNDLMKDRVLLDEEVAWMLFGGVNLQGMTVKLNGVPFIVAGVIHRESDFASRKAFTDERGLFMSYEGLRMLDENAKINCYEFVMAEPVKGFALNTAREKFPIGRGEIICNSTRYDYWNLMDIMFQFGKRGSETSGAIVPYWENAARRTENWAGLSCMAGTLLLIFPAVTLTVWLFFTGRKLKERTEEQYWPELRDKTEEAVRVRQRKHWERVHGKQEN